MPAVRSLDPSGCENRDQCIGALRSSKPASPLFTRKENLHAKSCRPRSSTSHPSPDPRISASFTFHLPAPCGCQPVKSGVLNWYAGVELDLAASWGTLGKGCDNVAGTAFGRNLQNGNNAPSADETSRNWRLLVGITLPLPSRSRISRVILATFNPPIVPHSYRCFINAQAGGTSAGWEPRWPSNLTQHPIR